MNRSGNLKSIKNKKILMIDKHRVKLKYYNFGYLSTKFWLKGNDSGHNNNNKKISNEPIIYKRTNIQFKTRKFNQELLNLP